MRKYQIDELGSYIWSYIELRILTEVECQLKMKKISQILEYLHFNRFLPRLSMFYYDEDNILEPDTIVEKPGVASLTIDMQNYKMRFKYYDGAKTYWVYHLKDLFEALVEGRNDFMELSQRYEPITNVIKEMQQKFNIDIINVRYQYYPEDKDVEIAYHLTFSKYVKEHKTENRLLNDINQEISLLNDNILKNVNFSIDFDFQSGCTVCEEAAKKKREENERKYRENKE